VYFTLPATTHAAEGRGGAAKSAAESASNVQTGSGSGDKAGGGGGGARVKTSVYASLIAEAFAAADGEAGAGPGSAGSLAKPRIVELIVATHGTLYAEPAKRKLLLKAVGNQLNAKATRDPASDDKDRRFTLPADFLADKGGGGGGSRKRKASAGDDDAGNTGGEGGNEDGGAAQDDEEPRGEVE
jgi:hypothetical protein